MDLLLALDMGTTHIKAATFTLDGAVRTEELIRNQTISLGSGSAIYDPHKLWESVKELLRRTTSQLRHGILYRWRYGRGRLFLGEDGAGHAHYDLV